MFIVLVIVQSNCHCRSSTGILHGCLQQDGAPSHTARNTPTYLRRENMTFIEPHMWPVAPKHPGLESSRLRCLGALQQMVYQRRRINAINQLNRQWSPSGAICWRISSIAPSVTGAIGLSGSSRSKANRLNI